MTDKRGLFPGKLNLDRLQYEVANEIGVDEQKLREVQKRAQNTAATAGRQVRPAPPRARDEDAWR